MGFLFLVLYPPPRPPARLLTHSPHSHTQLTHSLTHPPTHPRTHARTHSLTCAFCVAGVAQSALPRGRMYALASLGSPPPFAWQAWDNLHCQGVGCTPWRPLGLRLFCVAGVGQCALPRGRMYALASLGSPPLFAWQAWHNVHCQGVGCTPWRPLGLRLFCVAGVAQCALPTGRMYALASLGSPPLLRGRRGTMCTAKGSDVRPGVPWVSASFAWQAWHNVHCQGVGCTPWRPLGLRLFCVAGVAQCALPRGRMYALASLGSPPLFRGRRGTMCTAKGVGCTPWRPLGLRLFCVAGVGQCALPRGRMYALASLGSPPLLRGRRGTMCTAKGIGCTAWRPLGLRLFCVAGVGHVHCQGVGCTPWRPLGLRLFCVAGVGHVHFAWQAWDNVHCQGIGCTAWRPLGSASFAWQAWDNVHLPRGLDGTPWRPLGSASFAWQAWDNVHFTWQAWDNVHCQGVGCTPWRPLGLRLFCVAGVGQSALPRGRMYALASLGSPPLLRGRRGTMCTAKGLEYALASLGLRLFCVAGAHSFTHSVTHSLTPLTPSHSLSSHSLTRSLSLTNTHLLTYSLTH